MSSFHKELHVLHEELITQMKELEQHDLINVNEKEMFLALPSFDLNDIEKEITVLTKDLSSVEDKLEATRDLWLYSDLFFKSQIAEHLELRGGEQHSAEIIEVIQKGKVYNLYTTHIKANDPDHNHPVGHYLLSHVTTQDHPTHLDVVVRHEFDGEFNIGYWVTLTL